MKGLPGKSLRFDIAEAYWCFYSDWHSGGLTDRCRSKGRGIATQLARLAFRPRPNLTAENLEADGREIYEGLVLAYHPNAHVCDPDERYWIYDARGIEVAKVCHLCEETKKAGYRSDIFVDADYWADEPIDEV